MAMEFKQLKFQIIVVNDPRKLPVPNPRVEVPVLIDGETVVCNSPDILAYLDRRFEDRPLYPDDAPGYARVREIERLADSYVDAIVTVIANWNFAKLPPMPPGLLAAAQQEMREVYDQLQARLASSEFVCGALSAADFALYPHIASGATLDLKADVHAHGEVVRWLKTMRSRPEGQTDLLAVREWWRDRDKQDADTERVNWGAYRLEWLLANGQADWFAIQVQEDKVLWSVGPKKSAIHCQAS